jgi:hypothetical protein
MRYKNLFTRLLSQNDVFNAFLTEVENMLHEAFKYHETFHRTLWGREFQELSADLI